MKKGTLQHINYKWIKIRLEYIFKLISTVNKVNLDVGLKYYFTKIWGRGWGANIFSFVWLILLISLGLLLVKFNVIPLLVFIGGVWGVGSVILLDNIVINCLNLSRLDYNKLLFEKDIMEANADKEKNGVNWLSIKLLVFKAYYFKLLWEDFLF